MKIGPFEVLAELGRGGMGVVYRVHNPALGRDVALKVLTTAGAGQPEILLRFEREGAALRALDHPALVKVHHVALDRDRPYIVMDLVEGRSLEDELRLRGALQPGEAAELCAQVAGALEHAHERGVLHRDLKPGNVILRPDGSAVLTDFGLARAIHETGRGGLTATGEILGTPAYMAPEQATGEEVGPSTDVYGLGATLYTLLCGRPPFEGPSVINVVSAVLSRPPRSPSELAPGVPAALSALCLRCLAKTPAERYPTAGALEAALRDWLAQEESKAQPGRLGRPQMFAAGLVVLGGIAAGVTIVLRRPPARSLGASPTAAESRPMDPPPTQLPAPSPTAEASPTQLPAPSPTAGASPTQLPAPSPTALALHLPPRS